MESNNLSFLKNFDKNINDYLMEKTVERDVIKGILTLLVILYAVRVAPNLPISVIEFLNRPIMKFFIFSVIIYSANVSPSLSMGLALIFMFTVNSLQGRNFYEFLENIDQVSVGTSKLKDSKEEAIKEGMNQMKEEIERSVQVSDMKQNKKTVMIKPEVVDTPNGKLVINPTVVVSPSVVEDENGMKVAVKPDVTVIEQTDDQQLEIPETQEKEMEPSKEPCYPVRQYDMKLVKPLFTNSDLHKYDFAPSSMFKDDSHEHTDINNTKYKNM